MNKMSRIDTFQGRHMLNKYTKIQIKTTLGARSGGKGIYCITWKGEAGGSL